MNASPQFDQLLYPLFEKYLAAEPNLEVIALATSDGFSVCSANKFTVDFEPDKMAAAASTLHSVSNAVSKQILNKTFDMTFIETKAGNVAFVALELAGKDYVLSMSASELMNIASFRLNIRRLGQDISDLAVNL